MNLFRLDNFPPEAAKLHADHRVRKIHRSLPAFGDCAHQTTSRRLRRDDATAMWGLALAAALVDAIVSGNLELPRTGAWTAEVYFSAAFRFRFGRRHAAADVVAWLSRNIPTRVPPGSTTPPQAMPEGHRGDDVVAAYRRYYAAEKQGYWVGERWVKSKWTQRGVPLFMVD